MALSLSAPRHQGLKLAAAVAGGLIVLLVMVWQAFALAGAPDPDAREWRAMLQRIEAAPAAPFRS